MAGKDTSWVVRDVPEDIRRKVKIYAAQQGVTMSQALTALVTMAENLIALGGNMEARDMILAMQHTQEVYAAMYPIYEKILANDIDGARAVAAQVTKKLAEIQRARQLAESSEGY
jgi:hypothetical protein